MFVSVIVDLRLFPDTQLRVFPPLETYLGYHRKLTDRSPPPLRGQFTRPEEVRESTSSCRLHSVQPTVTMPNLGDVFPDFTADTNEGTVKFHEAINGS